MIGLMNVGRVRGVLAAALAGLACAGGASAQPVSECGTVVRGVECNMFALDDGGLYILFIPGAQVGERYSVTGTVNPECVSFCMQGDGCITDAQVTPCLTGGPTIGECATVVPGVTCPLLLETDSGLVLVGELPAGAAAGNRYFAIGQVMECATVCNQGDGCFVGVLEPCESPAPCRADFNREGGATVQDIYDFLTAWQTLHPRADFNRSGGVTVQDIYDFLGTWSEGCD